MVESIARRLDLKTVSADATGWVSAALRRFMTGSLALATGWVIMAFILFFFLRDRRIVLATVERYLPFSQEEVHELYRTADDTIHATVWGTIGVGVLQGTLGGLVFWWLGLPAPILWGTVMAFLSVLPVLGAAIVWFPVAAFLALQGNWTDAVILTVYGTIVIGLVDNLVYPLVVKNRIRMHVVPVFVSIVGGLIVFGASGVVLGPLLLALTDTLVTLWRRRLGIRAGPDALAEHAANDSRRAGKSAGSAGRQQRQRQAGPEDRDPRHAAQAKRTLGSRSPRPAMQPRHDRNSSQPPSASASTVAASSTRCSPAGVRRRRAGSPCSRPRQRHS